MIVLDTNVVSELMRPTPSPVVARWVRKRPGNELHTTAITLAEIGYGIERLPDGHRREVLRTTAQDVLTAFADRVLPFDLPAAVEYATVAGTRERAGTPITAFDAQIAAICRVHGAVLATRNRKDFQDTGIELVDPWQQVS